MIPDLFVSTVEGPTLSSGGSGSVRTCLTRLHETTWRQNLRLTHAEPVCGATGDLDQNRGPSRTSQTSEEVNATFAVVPLSRAAPSSLLWDR